MEKEVMTKKVIRFMVKKSAPPEKILITPMAIGRVPRSLNTPKMHWRSTLSRKRIFGVFRAN